MYYLIIFGLSSISDMNLRLLAALNRSKHLPQRCREGSREGDIIGAEVGELGQEGHL